MRSSREEQRNSDKRLTEYNEKKVEEKRNNE